MYSHAAIKPVENEESSSQAKHVDVRLKLIGAIKLTYVNTHDMLADTLTKPPSASTTSFAYYRWASINVGPGEECWKRCFTE
ncbi:hypothetical protein DD237_007649 [Peronospora effusa]|uniref:Uncharacterized protein n=1 Tax=Peronospora effusa TaxID=542832 RepID=A0A425C4M8_9STRA|nr:hypothetical protein DD237_007649 [Peronospora effusa]